MIDFHSHILHGVDDGSKSEEMTIKMLKLAEKSGTDGIVATPHFFRGRFQTTYKEVKENVAELKNLVNENHINIKVYCGQEIYYTDRILESFKCGDIGTIEDSRYMLIELPLNETEVDKAIGDIYEIQLKGIVPIIAHPERYEIFIKDPCLINKFIEEGFLFQLNTGSITGDFGRKAKKTAEIFIRNKIYTTIGSDAHRIEKRTTDMRAGIMAIERIMSGYTKEMKMFSGEILKDNAIKFQGDIIKKRSRILDLLKK